MAISYFLRACCLIVMGLLVYSQTFHFGFVFDDYIFIVNNPYIKNISNTHLMWQAFPMTRLMGMYSFAFNYMWGNLNASSYHIFNFIIHLCSTAFVWILSQMLFKIGKVFPKNERMSQEIPFIIALIFLVHPCQIQAITYITQRFESLATLFYLATIYFYLRARLAKTIEQQVFFFASTGVFTILGILTKEVVITVPAMILSLEWIFFPGKNNKRLIVFLIGAGFLLYVLFTKLVHADLKMLMQTYHSESHEGDILTLPGYVLTQMRVFLTFLRLLILPIHQALDYDYPVSTDLFHPLLTLVGLIVMVSIVGLIVAFKKNYPVIAFGLSWVLITFSINMVPRVNVIFEHKLYLISYGFFLALGASLPLLVKNRSTLLKILYSIIIVLSILSFERNKVWASELTLWQSNVNIFPDKARVNANLGRAYAAEGNTQQAIFYLTRAIDLSPDNISYENRGIIYGNIGQEDLALKDLNHSIAMDPQYATTYIKRAWVFQNLNQLTPALNDLNRAISLDPYYSDAYIQRGILWMYEHQNQAARRDFQEALRIDPYNTLALELIKKVSN